MKKHYLKNDITKTTILPTDFTVQTILNYSKSIQSFKIKDDRIVIYLN